MLVFSALSTKIFSSGNNIAGENYTLTCMVTVAEEVDDTLTAHWSGPGVHSDGVTATDVFPSTIDLTFTPLRQSHDGDYTCFANLEEVNYTDSETAEIITAGKL